MSGSNLSAEGEFRYVLKWFDEWSELQRDDFLPILAEYCGGPAEPQVELNGVVAGLAAESSCENKPMSLFQCRIKLFKEWSAKWPEDFKSTLQEKIIEVDSTVTEKLAEILTPNLTTNGNCTPTLSAPHVHVAAEEHNETNGTLDEEEGGSNNCEIAQNS